MSSYDLAEIWVKFTENFKKTESEKVFTVWIKPVMPIEVTDEYFKIVVKNGFFKKMLEDNYSSIIENILEEIMEKRVSLIIETIDNSSPAESTSLKPDQPALFENPKPKTEKTNIHGNLNPKYSFSNFVIGNSNRFAYAAAQAVSKNPATAYNPLFLYGGVGLGKTHLMYAIGNYIKETQPDLKVLYISSEKFTNEIVNSISNKTTESFRRKYRNIDCLIIDDIQFLKGKERTQEEFFHTFNELHEANKQIVISSDRLPKEIETLEKRLQTRFESGLMADIQSPDVETRMAILRQKSSIDKIDLPSNVIELLANNITSNIREIEGAYTKIVARSSLLNIPINIETAKKILEEMVISVSVHQITFDTITKTVSNYYHIKQEELLSKKRTKTIVIPRQVVMYLCREEANLSYPRIGELLGGRDHTTVMYAYEKISKNIKKDSNLQNDIINIINIIKK